jgi:CBS domain-containing protein
MDPVPDPETTTAAWAAASPVGRRMRPLVWADAGATIGEAARLLDGTDDSCVLVRLPAGFGIATDHDFRASLAKESVRRETTVGGICSAPVVTVNERTDAPSALLVMIEHGIHHLVVTTDIGEPVGVLRIVDLASAEVRDPVLIRRLVARAQTLDDIRAATAMLGEAVLDMAEIGTPALGMSAVLSGVRDLVVQRVVELTPTLVPPDSLSWLVLGSAARREALPHSDVDTALVWPSALAGQAPQLRDDAEHVLSSLEWCGLSRCPDGANATEPLFSRSVDDWVEATRRWTHHPESDSALLLASIVADNRSLTNVDVGSGLMRAMLDSARNRAFLDALLGFTMAVRPVRGVLHGIAVDHGGAHKGQLDLKRGGLWPVVLLGRWVALAVGDPSGSTVDRIWRGTQSGLLTTGEADDLIAAFEQIFQLRFDQEVTALKEGRESDSYVVPGSLDPLRQRFLHDSLHAVSRIQASIRRAWSSTGPG